MKRNPVIVLCLLWLAACHPHSNPTTPWLDPTVRQNLSWIQQTTFGYFTNAIGTNGLIQDRMSDPRLSSTMAAGFQLTGYCIAAQHEWLTRQQAVAYTLNTLRTYARLPRFHGMFAHFYDIQTGEVIPLMHPNDNGADVSETGFFMAGVLTCQAFFTNGTPQETEIRTIAQQLYNDVEWDWMLQDAYGNRLATLSWHWSPTDGFRVGSAQRVQANLELSSMITYILAMTSPTHPIPFACWNDGWCSDYIHETHNDTSFITRPALFNHQYAQIWLDLRNCRDRHADYFRNSTHASLANWQYCTTNLYPGTDLWGLTYCDGPFNYGTYGYPPKQGPIDTEAVIAPTAPGGSIVFTPQPSINALNQMLQDYPDLWGTYGFYDSLSPRLNWYDNDYIAIDQGPIVLMPANYMTDAVWKLFMANTNIQHTLDQIGFVGIIDDMEDGHIHIAPSREETSPFPNMHTLGGLAPYANWKSVFNCTIQYTTNEFRVGNQALLITPESPAEQVFSVFPANQHFNRYQYISLVIRNFSSPIIILHHNQASRQLPLMQQVYDASGWTRHYYRLPTGISPGPCELRIHSQAGTPWYIDDITLCNHIDSAIPASPSHVETSQGLSHGEIILSWTPVSPAPYRYIIKTSNNDLNDASVLAHTPEYFPYPSHRITGQQTNAIITGLTPGQSYYISIQSESLSGNQSRPTIQTHTTR